MVNRLTNAVRLAGEADPLRPRLLSANSPPAADARETDALTIWGIGHPALPVKGQAKSKQRQSYNKYINDSQKKIYYSGKPYDIQVAFCRYCKTGYCFDKQKQVTLTIESSVFILPKGYSLKRMF